MVGWLPGCGLATGLAPAACSTGSSEAELRQVLAAKVLLLGRATAEGHESTPA